MATNSIFTANNEAGVASYSFNDISSGSSYINMYVGKAGTANSTIMTNYKFYSSPIITTSAGLVAGADAKMLDLDFDYLINKQIVIAGQSIVNIPIGCYSSTANPNAIGYAIVKIRKWDGVTETELSGAGGQTETLTGPVGGVTMTVFYVSAIVTIAQSIIKKGEYLRVTIEVWGHHSGGIGDGSLKLAHDPMNRLTGWSATATDQTIITIPLQVKINT